MTWQGQRRLRLPPDWPAIRAAILERDGHTCQTCSAPATDVDHITPGDNHHPTNLAAICTPCHRHKSAMEGNAAQGAGPGKLRPVERHPGAVN